MKITSQDQSIIWLSTASEKERFEYLGRILDCFKTHELKDVQSKVKCAWKRKYRQENAAVPSSGPEASGPEADEGDKKTDGWWTKYLEENIVAIDTEHVDLVVPDAKKRSKLVGEVSVVNFKKEIIYQSKIEHPPFTIKDNITAGYHTELGIKGKSYTEARKDIENLLRGKLVILCGGEPDFYAFDLAISNFDTFDLHSHFRKESKGLNKSGGPVFQPIGLRSLYFEFFKTDIQSGYHSSATDAKATMELFHKYIELKKVNLSSRSGTFDEFEEFKNIPTLKRDFHADSKSFYVEKKRLLYK